jgi:hypothetical protein
MDTTPRSTASARRTPLGADDTYRATVWGTNGDCTIDERHRGVAQCDGNRPTAGSYLTVFPADATRPTASASIRGRSPQR